MNDAEGPTPAWERFAAAALIVLATLFAFGRSLDGVFVYDDIPAIIQNPTIRHPGDLAALLSPPGDEAGTVGGRPLVNLSLALNYAIGGTRPLGYHVFNLAVHVCASLLLFGIVRRTLGKAPARRGGKATPHSPWTSLWGPAGGLAVAFCSALLWSVHPLQTEAVTYVVQRAESLMGLFYLLTLYSFMRFTADGSSRAWAAVAFTACACGMATKEAMVSAPIVVFLYDRWFVAGSFGEAWRRRRSVHAGLGATWLILAFLVAGTHGRGGSAGFGEGHEVTPYLLTQCAAVVRYLGLAFFPAPLVFDYGTALVRTSGDVAAPIALLVAILASASWAVRRRSAAGFLAICFFLLLAPTSSVIPIVTEPVAEHRMYLPLAAVCIFSMGSLFSMLSLVAPRRPALALCLIAGAAAVCIGAATDRRNLDYRSALALWGDTARKAPANPRALNNLAEAMNAMGDGVAAAGEFEAAVAVDPRYAPAQYNLGVTLLDAGRPAEAVAHLEMALPAPLHKAELRFYLGQALERTGRHGEAAERFREALALAPRNADAAFGLGNNLAVQGRYADAVVALRQAVALAPGSVRIRNNLANALLFAGHPGEAVAEYREALKRDPANPSVRENLERALAAMAADAP